MALFDIYTQHPDSVAHTTHGDVEINAEYGVCLIPTISLLPFLGISKELFLTRINYLNQSKIISDNNYKLTEDQFHYLLTGEHLV